MPDRTVDPFYSAFTVTTVAGVDKAAPTVTALAVTHATLEVITVTIPPGHHGTTGIRFKLAGALVLPYEGGDAWIIGDNLVAPFELGVEVDRGFTVETYNTGNYPHSHYLRLRSRSLGSGSQLASVSIIPASQLNGAA